MLRTRKLQLVQQYGRPDCLCISFIWMPAMMTNHHQLKENAVHTERLINLSYSQAKLKSLLHFSSWCRPGHAMMANLSRWHAVVPVISCTLRTH